MAREQDMKQTRKKHAAAWESQLLEGAAGVFAGGSAAAADTAQQGAGRSYVPAD